MGIGLVSGNPAVPPIHGRIDLCVSRFSFLVSRFSLTRCTLAALSLLGLAALAPTAQAQTTVYNNGTFGTANALTITDLTLADDFVLASPTSFDAIRFWAVDGNPGLWGTSAAT